MQIGKGTREKDDFAPLSFFSRCHFHLNAAAADAATTPRRLKSNKKNWPHNKLYMRRKALLVVRPLAIKKLNVEMFSEMA